MCQSLDDALNQLKTCTHIQLEYLRRHYSFRRQVILDPFLALALLTIELTQIHVNDRAIAIWSLTRSAMD